jgi:hypothetical protein
MLDYIRVSSNFRNDITVAENNAILALALSSYRKVREVDMEVPN